MPRKSFSLVVLHGIVEAQAVMAPSRQLTHTHAQKGHDLVLENQSATLAVSELGQAEFSVKHLHTSDIGKGKHDSAKLPSDDKDRADLVANATSLINLSQSIQNDRAPPLLHVNVSLETRAGAERESRDTNTRSGAECVGCNISQISQTMERRAWNSHMHHYQSHCTYRNCKSTPLQTKEELLKHLWLDNEDKDVFHWDDEHCCSFCQFLNLGRRNEDGTYPIVREEDAYALAASFAESVEDIYADLVEFHAHADLYDFPYGVDANSFALLAFWKLRAFVIKSAPLPVEPELSEQIFESLPGILLHLSDTWRREMHAAGRNNHPLRQYMSEAPLQHSSILEERRIPGGSKKPRKDKSRKKEPRSCDFSSIPDPDNLDEQPVEEHAVFKFNGKMGVALQPTGVVYKVNEGGQADLEDIKPGDRIIRVNTVAFKKGVLTAAEGSGSEYTVEVERNHDLEDVEEKGDVDKHSCSQVRVYHSAPNEGWESLLPEQRPRWWRPEGSVRPPAGKNVALAFRGDYHTLFRGDYERYKHCPELHVSCSDYWVNKESIFNAIVEPLENASVNVRVYFHTYSDAECKTYDTALVRDLNPSKYDFDKNYPSRRNSYVEVMKLVIEENWADYVVLLRFDVEYNAPITSWNLQWEAINHPFLDSYFETNPLDNDDDLVFTVPKRWFGVFVEGFKGGRSAVELKKRMQDKAGQSSVHQIDEQHNGPPETIASTSFRRKHLGCGPDYDKWCASNVPKRRKKAKGKRVNRLKTAGKKVLSKNAGGKKADGKKQVPKVSQKNDVKAKRPWRP